MFALETGTNSERWTDGVLMYVTNCLTYWRSIKIILKISSPYMIYTVHVIILHN